jgi:hypothetical protein
VGLFVALGCGGLLLLSVIGAGAAYFWARSTAEDISEKLEEASKSAAGGGSGVASSEVCAQAAACCAAMVTKTGGTAESLKACEALKNMPSLGCAQALETYKKAAPLAGFKCE